jgi:hypothetical protein
MSERYALLRHVTHANLVNGTVTFALPAPSGQNNIFADTEIASIAIDVMVNDGGIYKNDLVSVWLQADGVGGLEVVVDAPAFGNNEVRLIAVNEAIGIN